VLPRSAERFLDDFRALGFADAGPLPTFRARIRPGRLRRLLTWVLTPPLRSPPGVEVRNSASSEFLFGDPVSEPAGWPFAGFGLAARMVPPGSGDEDGVVLFRERKVAAFARWPAARNPDVLVSEWIAPPQAPELAGFLGAAILRAVRAAGPGETRAVTLATPHRTLAGGLLRGGFLPGSAIARILVRQGGDRTRAAPDPGDWHLTAPTRFGRFDESSPG